MGEDLKSSNLKSNDYIFEKHTRYCLSLLYGFLCSENCKFTVLFGPLECSGRDATVETKF